MESKCGSWVLWWRPAAESKAYKNGQGGPAVWISAFCLLVRSCCEQEVLPKTPVSFACIGVDPISRSPGVLPAASLPIISLLSHPRPRFITSLKLTTDLTMDMFSITRSVISLAQFALSYSVALTTTIRSLQSYDGH